MGKGGDPVVEKASGNYTWEEIKHHAQNNDKWLVIDGTVYNITQWAQRHPGGPRIISHYSGQDATEAFKAFHTDMKLVSKYMPTLEIGKVTGTKSSDEEIKKDFVALRKKAEEMELFTPSKLFYILTFLHLIFFEALAYFVMSYYGTGWLSYSASVLFLLISLSQAGWHQHDFGHLSVFKNNRINHMFHSIVMNLIKGASTSWWQHLHNQHHSKPNVLNKDPDVKLDPLFVVGETIPKKMAEKKNSKMPPYNWQQFYFFAVGPPLLFPIYFQYMVFKHPIVRRQWLDVFLMSLFYVKFLVLYAPLLGLFGALKFFFIVRCLESHWFVWVSQSNHIPMDIEEDKERPWLALQLYATCDVEKSYFNDWFTGHLNFQIEHHLFPTMPRHNLYKIQPLVRELCAKHHIPYKLKTLREAFIDIVKSLKRSGEIWRDHYHSLHSD